MKTTDLALAPVNKLTFLLGVGAIVVAIVYGEYPTRPAPATEALMPPWTRVSSGVPPTVRDDDGEAAESARAGKRG